MNVPLVLVAYLAAGAYFVIRDLRPGTPIAAQIRGLIVIAVLWLPISIVDVLKVKATSGASSAINRCISVLGPPLILFVAIVIAGLI